MDSNRTLRVDQSQQENREFSVENPSFFPPRKTDMDGYESEPNPENIWGGVRKYDEYMEPSEET